MNKVSNNFNFDIFISEFNEKFNKYSIDKIDNEEKEQYFYNIVNAYYYLNSINPFDILFDDDMREKINKLEIEKNIFKVKYNLIKFNLWDLLNEEIKKYYEMMIKIYIKFYNIIDLQKFESKLLTKIKDEYYYNNSKIENEKPFIFLEFENEFIYYYFKNGLLYYECINKINCGRLNLIGDGIYNFDKYKFKKNNELFKYFDNIIEFDKKIKELQ